MLSSDVGKSTGARALGNECVRKHRWTCGCNVMCHIVFHRTVAGASLCHGRDLSQQAEERVVWVLLGVCDPGG